MIISEINVGNDLQFYWRRVLAVITITQVLEKCDIKTYFSDWSV